MKQKMMQRITIVTTNPNKNYVVLASGIDYEDGLREVVVLLHEAKAYGRLAEFGVYPMGKIYISPEQVVCVF